MIQKNQWLAWIIELQALVQSGMTYCKNKRDKTNYLRLYEIASEMATLSCDKTAHEILEQFSAQKGYATPKIDVRAFVLQANKVMLIKEKNDDLWRLPGGFAVLNESPSETLIGLTYRDSGYLVRVNRLLALWDQQQHDHPPQWPHSYQYCFHCMIIAEDEPQPAENKQMAFFEIEHLPQLATLGVTSQQMMQLYENVIHQQLTQLD